MHGSLVLARATFLSGFAILQRVEARAGGARGVAVRRRVTFDKEERGVVEWWRMGLKALGTVEKVGMVE